jgi:Na+-translocating ferredoxin:NAD+ oxidoreductase RnfA subunit
VIAGIVQLLLGVLSSTVFILVLFIGFCVFLGFTKLKRTAGGGPVVKSLDEAVSRQAVTYLSPSAPHGPANQLRSPELVEAAARK